MKKEHQEIYDSRVNQGLLGFSEPKAFLMEKIYQKEFTLSDFVKQYQEILKSPMWNNYYREKHLKLKAIHDEKHKGDTSKVFPPFNGGKRNASPRNARQDFEYFVEKGYIFEKRKDLLT